MHKERIGNTPRQRHRPLTDRHTDRQSGDKISCKEGSRQTENKHADSEKNKQRWNTKKMHGK